MSRCSRESYGKTKKSLLEQLKKEKQKSEEYLKQLKYLQADFENYRKRIEKEIQDLAIRSNEKMVANLLNVIDDLERALEAGKTTKDSTPLLQGVEMVCRNLLLTLKKEGLASIEALGKPFDPNFQEMVETVPRNDCKEGLVIEEIRKGFMFKGRVLRPSMVKIACREIEVKRNE